MTLKNSALAYHEALASLPPGAINLEKGICTLLFTPFPRLPPSPFFPRGRRPIPLIPGRSQYDPALSSPIPTDGRSPFEKQRFEFFWSRDSQ